MLFWRDELKYCGIAPGVNQEGAQWIADHGVSLTGNDTSAFEKMDRTHKQVHILLLARRGIQIMENLYLEELARDAKWEFIFVALPLRIRGGTGSPIRPIAICQ
jgi:kynurenine formamidase